MIGTSVLGVLIALLTGLNIFGVLGFAVKWNAVGIVLTGLIAGGGSNYIHDLTKN